MSTRCSPIVAMVVGLAASPALASGFGFYEQGAKGSAQAGAWVARADDASANWYNPAALVHLTGHEIQFGINYVRATGSTAFEPAVPPPASIDPVPNSITPAHLYFSHKINDRFAWGIGLCSPFGLVSEWDDPVLTVSSRRADLQTFLLNPNVAIKLGNYWSVALGADYIYANVRDFSRDLVPGAVNANLEGNGDAWGYNFAVQFKRESFSLAGQYRSAFKAGIDGDLTIGGPGGFTTVKATTDLDLPGQTMIGAAWIGKRVEVEGAAYYTQWNYFKTLEVILPPTTTPTIIIPENWEGTWSYRAGVAVRLGEAMKHELRAGAVRDISPVPPEFLRASIPDSDRTGVTVGYGYSGKNWGIDVYGMYFDFDDAVANGSPADAVINGTYTVSVVLAGVTGKYRF